MSKRAQGMLAIWSTVAGDFETDYLHWLTREHVFERVGVPGFLSGAVYRRQRSEPSEYLIVYALADAAVMGSDAYRARLDSPTPWTQRVMPQLRGFRRGGGRIVAQAGEDAAFGARLAVARVDGVPTDVVVDAVPALLSLDRLSRVRVMAVAQDATAIATREKSMRTGDEGAFGGVIAIDALDDDAVYHAMLVANELLPAGSVFEAYDLVFTFSAAD